MSVIATKREEVIRTVTITCVDGLMHEEKCRFVEHDGVLPCSCEGREEGSWWWDCWLYWTKVRTQEGSDKYLRTKNESGKQIASDGRAVLPWPIRGADGSPWIVGRDFGDLEERPVSLADQVTQVGIDRAAFVLRNAMIPMPEAAAKPPLENFKGTVHDIIEALEADGGRFEGLILD